eukprot:3053513-Alexandrium_andersonii.AAC.1
MGQTPSSPSAASFTNLQVPRPDHNLILDTGRAALPDMVAEPAKQLQTCACSQRTAGYNLTAMSTVREHSWMRKVQGATAKHSRQKLTVLDAGT